MSLVEVAVAVAIVVGLIGIVLPILPGTVIILAALVIWGSETGGQTAWIVTSIAVVLLAAGAVIKFLVPGRTLRAAVPTPTLVAGAMGAVIGFFVIPVVGLLIGFPIGIYAAERVRVGAQAAWPSTKHALRAIGVSIMIEFAFGVLAAGVWVVGLLVT